MATRKQIAVLGLGRFGDSVARELARLGHDVLALDNNERTIQEISEAVAQAAQVDITNADALRNLGVAEMDAAIVAVSTHIEVSILATVILERMGIKRIIAKARDELHGSILSRVGANLVIYPERETGIRVAHSFDAPGVQDYLDVAPGYGFARIAVDGNMVGQTLARLDLKRTCNLTPMALHRGGSITLNPGGSEQLLAGDELVVAGLDEDLERLPGGTAQDG